MSKEPKIIELNLAEVRALRKAIDLYRETKYQEWQDTRSKSIWPDHKFYDGGKIEERLDSIMRKLR